MMPLKDDGTKTMSSLRFLFNYADLLFPSVAASFAAVVGCLFSAGFFPIAAATQRGEGFVGEDGGGGRSKMRNCHLACGGRRWRSGARDR